MTNTVDLLAGEEAQRKFCEYDELYGDFRMMIVNHSYFFRPECGRNGVPARILFDDAFMRECFAKIGCETVWDEVAKPKYLLEIDKDAIVVTKEWLCAEYDKAFAGTELDIKNIEKIQKKYKEELRCIK